MIVQIPVRQKWNSWKDEQEANCKPDTKAFVRILGKIDLTILDSRQIQSGTVF
jgi:hypothetical protein